MDAIPRDRHSVVHLIVEPPKPESPTLKDRVKEAVGMIIALIGLVIVLGTTATLVAVLLGHTIVPMEMIHTMFMTGVVSAVAGFHIVKSSSTEVNVGPLALTV